VSHGLEEAERLVVEGIKAAGLGTKARGFVTHNAAFGKRGDAERVSHLILLCSILFRSPTRGFPARRLGFRDNAAGSCAGVRIQVFGDWIQSIE
jgi:hypothetical protein